MKKILITGANGMVGSAIVHELINKYELILVAPNIGRIEKYKEKAKIVNKNIYNISDWENLLNGVHTVVHLAAVVHPVSNTREEEQRFIQNNVEATKILYNACSKYFVRKFLFFSTNDVYRHTKQLITENSSLELTGIYAKSKLLAEQYLLVESKRSKTEVCIFRPASIYGENDNGSMNSLISFCYKGVIPMIGKGEHKKTLLYIDDVVGAVEKYIENEADLNGEIFNISSGDYSYKEIIETISNVFSLKPVKVFIPRWFCTKIAPHIDVLKKLAVAAEIKTVSSEKAYKLLNYESEFDLKIGLEDSKEYYKKE